MADRPCDCLRPKSSVCSCRHCQWFCAGRPGTRDAVAICRERKTRTDLLGRRNNLNRYAPGLPAQNVSDVCVLRRTGTGQGRWLPGQVTWTRSLPNNHSSDSDPIIIHSLADTSTHLCHVSCWLLRHHVGWVANLHYWQAPMGAECGSSCCQWY